MKPIEKPPHGSPCNSCGMCCLQACCPIAERLFKQSAGPCPAIERQADGRHLCGLMTNPAKYAPPRVVKFFGADRMAAAAKHLNGVGNGCDAIAQWEEPNREFEAKQNRAVNDPRNWPASDAAAIVWGLVF